VVDVAQVGLESINFTLVDVVEGHDEAFNAWYENDHFYAGGVLGPSVLGGRRWYCPKSMRDVRFAGSPCPFEDPTTGTNLATYFFTLPDGGREFRDWVARSSPNCGGRVGCSPSGYLSPSPFTPSTASSAVPRGCRPTSPWSIRSPVSSLCLPAG